MHFLGILLLCGVVLSLTDFIEGFTVTHGAAVWMTGFRCISKVNFGIDGQPVIFGIAHDVTHITNDGKTGKKAYSRG